VITGSVGDGEGDRERLVVLLMLMLGLDWCEPSRDMGWEE